MATEPTQSPIGPKKNQHVKAAAKAVGGSEVDVHRSDEQTTDGTNLSPRAAVAAGIDMAAAPLHLPEKRGIGDGLLGIGFGLVTAGVFFLFAWLFPLPWIDRYFLGHPVSIAETILFAIACSILALKVRRVRAQARLTAALRDEDLMPALPTDLAASDQWILRNNAGMVAKLWLASLRELPKSALGCPLVLRLAELLQRQSTRVSTQHLADDQREISAREGDTAHDSLQLVRIIVWAIPMLGFLGTVVGITQTLGGLDFSNGTDAVDQLKTGLYVAFDTTALGLVLSVGAIFLQFPVERSEQQLLAEIDRRVGMMLAAKLPSDDHGDNPAAHIAALCDGIRVAVGQSLTSQAELWRTTIDEAHKHWQQVADDNGQRIGDALTASLTPILASHSLSLDEHAKSLRGHAKSLGEIRASWNEDLQNRWMQWNDAFSQGTELVVGHRKLLDRQAATLVEQNQRMIDQNEHLAKQGDRLVQHTDSLVDTGRRAEQLSLLQRSLDANLLRLSEVNAAVQHGLAIHDQSRDSEAVSAQLSDAMLALARAVDLLGKQLPPSSRGAIAAGLASSHAHAGDGDAATGSVGADVSIPAKRRAA